MGSSAELDGLVGILGVENEGWQKFGGPNVVLCKPFSNFNEVLRCDIRTGEADDGTWP